MRKPIRLLALATVVAAAAAFPAVAGASQSTTTTPANAPSGTHYKSGGPATCTVSGNTVTCGGTPSTSSYTLAGVGNADVKAVLSATYSATVVCTNPGGNLSDSQHQGTFSSSTSSGVVKSKNGNVTVPSLSSTAPTESQFLAQQTCPNPNWTPSIQGGISLSSFTYTVTFVNAAGNPLFQGPYITITGNDP